MPLVLQKIQQNKGQQSDGRLGWAFHVLCMEVIELFTVLEFDKAVITDISCRWRKQAHTHLRMERMSGGVYVHGYERQDLMPAFLFVLL